MIRFFSCILILLWAIALQTATSYAKVLELNLISRSTSNWDIRLFEAIQKVLCASENTLRIIAGNDPIAYV